MRPRNRSDLMRLKVLVLCLSVGALLVSCTVGPNYVRPKMDMPSRYSESAATTRSTTQAASRPSTAPAAPLVIWWRNFQDPQLDSLIDRAIRSNLSLQAAESRIRQARAQYGIVAAGAYPTLTGSGSYSRTGRGKASARPVTSLGTVSSSSRPRPDFWQAGFDASWEVDVFGGIRRSTEAGRANIPASVEDPRNVLITFSSSV